MANVRQTHRLTLDGNAPFTLDFHGIENLALKLPIRYDIGILNQPIRQGRFPMILKLRIDPISIQKILNNDRKSLFYFRYKIDQTDQSPGRKAKLNSICGYWFMAGYL